MISMHFGVKNRCGANKVLMALSVALVLIFSGLSSAWAATVNIKVGEVKIMKPGDIERVAVGNTGFMGTSLLKNGQLLLFGESPGATTLHLWLKNGQELDYEIYVDEAAYAQTVNSGVLRQKFTEIDALIGDVLGLEMSIVGPKIVLSGHYVNTVVIDAVKANYADVILDLSLSTKLSEVQQLLEHVPGIELRVVGDRIVIHGVIGTTFVDTIATVAAAYPEIMDLTRLKDEESVDDKMVLMNVKITEFNRAASDSLGINWTTNFAGPAGAFAHEVGLGGRRGDGVTILGAPGTPTSIAGVDVAQVQPSFGYFGIATEIASRINVAVSSGDALILAEPRLIARSGGEASFLAGGEVPIEIVTPTSASIEFKEFGILMNISPRVDAYDNIRATVETEISAVDQSVSVGNTPGFLTRRTSADVLLRSGETLVMSGLVDRELGRDVSAVKGLGAIPILGALFRSRDFRDSITDLVIFVTPLIYDASHQQNIEDVAREQQRTGAFIESMRGSTFKLLD